MYTNTVKFQESISLGSVPDDRPLGSVPDENLGVNYAINQKEIQCCTIY